MKKGGGAWAPLTLPLAMPLPMNSSLIVWWMRANHKLLMCTVAENVNCLNDYRVPNMPTKLWCGLSHHQESKLQQWNSTLIRSTPTETAKQESTTECLVKVHLHTCKQLSTPQDTLAWTSFVPNLQHGSGPSRSLQTSVLQIENKTSKPQPSNCGV